MDWVKDRLLWFSGGANQYMPSSHCMGDDQFWIISTIALSALIVLGYLIIAYGWKRSEQLVAASETKNILRSLRGIFIWCAICGYGFNILRFYWPAWRLLNFAMLFLTFYTFYYIFRSRGLRTVYERLDKVDQLQSDIERMESDNVKQRFFMNALSHDLRSPINAVVLNADLARICIETNQRDVAIEAVTTIKENSLAATDLLNRLLEFARFTTCERNDLCTYSAVELLATVQRRHEEAARAKGVDLIATSTADLPMRVDASKIERIVNNLVENAIKFTSTGGVRIEASQDGAHINIRVSDTGSGVSAEHQPLLFGEFFQVGNYERDRLKGFGMGLAVSRVLARQMGGDVTLTHTSNRGSTFQCRVPASVESGESAGRGGRPRCSTSTEVAVAP